MLGGGDDNKRLYARRKKYKTNAQVRFVFKQKVPSLSCLSHVERFLGVRRDDAAHLPGVEERLLPTHATSLGRPSLSRRRLNSYPSLARRFGGGASRGVIVTGGGIVDGFSVEVRHDASGYGNGVLVVLGEVVGHPGNPDRRLFMRGML